MERKRRKVRFRVQVRLREGRVLRPVYATVEIDRVTGEVIVRELRSRQAARTSLSRLADHALAEDAGLRAYEARLERMRDQAARRACGVAARR